MNEKYLVIDEIINGDSFETVCDSAEEANREAAYQWDHLTERERKQRHLYAVIVKREWLSEDAIDEDDGSIDWAMFDQADTFPGAFDSEEV